MVDDTDRWVWELPGGYVDGSEDPAVTAAREVEEETGWRPLGLQPLLAIQPMVGTLGEAAPRRLAIEEGQP